MKLFKQLMNQMKVKSDKKVTDYQREALIREGKEQFQLLIKRGLTIKTAI